MGRRAIIKGAAILTAANLITRFIGFFYRLFMSNTIGAEGMGLYQLIMPIYMLAWSISSSGFTTTISKLTAQEKAKKQYGNMGRILKQSLILSTTISILLMVLLYTFSYYISVNIIKDPRTEISLKILALSFPFMSAGSCIRGYFFGVQHTIIPAASQVAEQIVRVVTVYSISALFVSKGLEYACAVAVMGVFMGEFLSFLLVFVSYIKYKKGNSLNKRPSISSSKTLIIIGSMAVPLTSSRVISSLLSTIENILIPQRLQLFGANASDAISSFGRLTGMAMPLIQLPSAILMAVSITLVPTISEAYAISNSRKIKYTASKTIIYTSIIGIGATALFMTFPYEICQMLYNDVNLGSLLFKLSLLCPFLYMQITFSGLLNGLGEHIFIFKNNLLSSVINIFFIYFFMPQYGMDAFIFGWFISLVVTSVHSMLRIGGVASINYSPKDFILKPVFSAVFAAVTAKLIFLNITQTKITLIISILIMYILYFIMLFLTECLNKNDIKSIMPSKH